MPRLSNAQWMNARKMWEDGASLTAVAAKYGVAMPTVSKHKKKAGWSRDGMDPATPADHIVESFAPEQTAPAYNDETLALQARVAELEGALAEAEAEVQEYRPVADINIYTTPDEVMAALGEQKIVDVASKGLADVNKERIKQGLSPFNYETNPALLQPYIDKLLQELLDRRTKWVTETSKVRVVKMVFNGNLIQVPVEQQISNEAGQAGTALWKMRDKGAKLASPYLCQMMNCWLPASEQGGSFTNSGYCGPQHEGMDPYLNKKPVPGVSTSGMQRQSRAATLSGSGGKVPLADATKASELDRF